MHGKYAFILLSYSWYDSSHSSVLINLTVTKQSLSCVIEPELICHGVEVIDA